MAEAKINIRPVQRKVDYATIIGLVGAISMIGIALVLGGRVGSFLDLRSALIVIVGTIAITAISYSLGDMGKAGRVIGRSFMQNIADSNVMAHQLLDLASVARSKGVLSLQEYTNQMAKDPFLLRAMNLVSDGVGAEDIDRLLGQEIESVTARHEHSAGMLKRASEVAPAMGLIGTLVGLVQMLAALDDPASIGPSMAVALLTTFYGALMGTVLLSPLAAKLERRSEDEFVIKTMVLLAAMSMSRKENPRRLEMLLNTTLPPEKRIRYFK